MRKNYQGKPGKSKGKFEVLGRKEVSVAGAAAAGGGVGGFAAAGGATDR